MLLEHGARRQVISARRDLVNGTWCKTTGGLRWENFNCEHKLRPFDCKAKVRHAIMYTCIHI